ncbi:hypothetical protein [Glycomyces tenuis]|uniref:hypothetical protein n=1 Tax=Glycomyces tenuis TaxID=58116 RepID=UPI0004009455|nr:hypothetical protein [Glycomyces tenuis]
MKALLNSLNENELSLVRETERERLVELDEDALAHLHDRVRRARNKYVGLYRREGGAKVVEHGGRGKARPKNLRNAQKAEVFEDALARVSRALAQAARRSATELKNLRLDAVRKARNTAPPRPAAPERRTRPATAPRAKAPSPATRKRRASSMAKGARRQAKRDAR